MAEPDIGKVAEKLISNVDEALGIVEGMDEIMESKPLRKVARALKTAGKAAERLVKIAEGLLEELAAQEEGDEEDEDDDWDDEEDDDDED